jgi:hypothetical protein
MKIKIFVLILILFISLPGIYAQDFSEKEVEMYLRAEYNRTYEFWGNISAIGSFKVDEIWAFRGGLNFGGTSGVTDIGLFASAGVTPFSGLRPLGFSLYYVYNGLPEYEAHSHAVLPFVFFNTKMAGIQAGCNFRFSTFFGSPAQFETELTFLAYLNFINNENLRLGISCGNLSDFNAANLGEMSLRFNSTVRVNDNWSVINDLILLQSGLDGFTAIFYGIAWRGGVKYSW